MPLSESPPPGCTWGLTCACLALVPALSILQAAVMLDQSLTSSKPQLPHLQNRNNNRIYLAHNRFSVQG